MSCQILTKEERNLMQAVHEGDLKAATKLIREDKVSVNIQDCLMRTPLLRTCYLQSQYTRCALAKLLLKNGAIINTTDKHGRTALMTACMETDREDLVKIMLNAKGVDANARDETGSTALMHAVRTDNVESVRTLVTWKPPPGLSRQVSVDLGDCEGMYPLLLAANQQNPDICEILVKDGEAPHGDIPTLLKKYLPPECRGGKRKPITNDPFEKYRHQAQDILNTPYRPPMMLAIDPESLPDIDDEAGHANDSPERKPDNNDQEPEETDNALKHAPDHWYPWMSAMSVTRLKKTTGDKNQSENDNCAEVDNASSKEVGLSRSDTFVKEPRKEPEISDSKRPPKSPPKSREAWTEKNKDSEKKKNEEKRLQEEDRKQKEKERKLEEEEKMRREEDRKQREKEKRREEEEKRQEEDRKQKENEKRREEEEKRQEEDRKQKEKEKRREEEEKRQEEEERKQKEKERKREEDRKQEERGRESKQTGDKPKKESERVDNAKPKDPKRQEDKPESKDKADKAPKESKEEKPKGQWIDEPKEEVEEEPPPLPPPPPPKSSKKKKKGGAYKTKGGRVIHPNVQNDPQYKKIMDAKKGGDQTGNSGSKGKQTWSKSANKSGTRSGTSGQQKRHGGQGRR